MKRSVVVGLTAFALSTTGLAFTASVSAAAEQPVPVSEVTGQVVSGRYIVTTRPGRAEASVAALSLAGARVRPDHVYGSALSGFAARLDAAQLRAVQQDPNVLRIEPDQVVTASVKQRNPTWGLDRLDQRKLPLSSSYSYAGNGSGVTAYIIDTGILRAHPDFGGRASVGYDATGGSGVDCNGHGTHVAGTIGGTTYGVAKKAKLVGVRVLNCQGSGTYADVIAGMDWVSKNAARPAVANMSLGGARSESVNEAANRIVSSGVFLAVAAGNNNGDACRNSPSSASRATSVAASDRRDAKASFSNYGDCTHLYAPGVDIVSTWLSGGTKTASGTSMASPHVAGVAAVRRGVRPGDSPEQVRSWLVENSTAGVIGGNPAGTPNKLLYKAPLL